MKEYKRCLAVIRAYLNDKSLKLNSKKLDKIISEELEKPIDETNGTKSESLLIFTL